MAAPALAVAGQILGVDNAAARGAQIAVFAAHHDAALAQKSRRESGVHLGRDIPVIGRAEFKAVAPGVAIARREEAALALIAQGKGEIRRIKDRDRLEAHHHMAGAAPVFAVIQINAPGIEPPELGAGRAGGVTRRRHLGAGIDRVAQALRRAPAAALQQEIIAAPEFTGLGVEIQKGRLALQIKPVIPIPDIAFKLRRVAGLVIDHLVRAGLAPLARDLHIPEQRGDAVFHQIGLIGADRGLVRFQPRLDHGPGRDGQRFRAK